LPEHARTPSTGRRLGRYVRVAVVLALATLIGIHFIDFHEMGRLLRVASPVLLLLTLAMATFDYVLMGVKWNLLLRAFQVRVPWHVPVAAYFRGQVFTLFVPSIFGMDAYRAYYLKQRGVRLLSTLSSIFVERFVGMLSSLSMICLLLPFALRGLDLPHPPVLVFVGVAGFLAITALLHVGVRHADRFEHLRVLRLLPGKLRGPMRRFLEATGKIKGRSKSIYIYYGVSNLEKVIYGTCVFLAACAIGVHEIRFLYIVAAIPFVALLERLPISVASLGIREGLFVAVLAPYGVDPTKAVMIALIIRAVELLRTLFGLALWIQARNTRPAKSDIDSIGHELGSALRVEESVT